MEKGKPTEVRKENGYCKIDFNIGLRSHHSSDYSNGLEARNSAMLSKICSTYDKEVYFVRKENNLKVNGKSLMELLCLEASPITRLMIEVEGIDKRAEKFARQLSEDSEDFCAFFTEYIKQDQLK